MAMYASSTFIGVSLWLVPAEPALALLQEAVKSTAKQHSGPVFKPHCTLLAGLSGSEDAVVQQTKELAAHLQPIQASIEALASKNLYFQSVFALLQKDPALLQLHKTATEHFQLPYKEGEYMPHVSLFYGDAAEDTKAEIRSGLQHVVGTSLSFDAIEVWSTAGAADEWRLCSTVPLAAAV
jgi:2'-5' RNA ligase